MRIRKGSELEDMSALSDDRLTFLNVVYKTPDNDKQEFIQMRIHREIARRCREAAHHE